MSYGPLRNYDLGYGYGMGMRRRVRISFVYLYVSAQMRSLRRRPSAPKSGECRDASDVMEAAGQLPRG